MLEVAKKLYSPDCEWYEISSEMLGQDTTQGTGTWRSFNSPSRHWNRKCDRWVADHRKRSWYNSINTT